MGVFLRVKLKSPFTFNRSLNLFRWHRAFLYDAVRQNRGHTSVEKVEYSVMDTLQADPQLVNSIPQEVRFRGANLVPRVSS